MRHYDQDERETDGAVQSPKLRKVFQKPGGQKFSDSDWLHYIYEGSNKTRFQCCKNSKNVLLYTFVPFKETLVGMMCNQSSDQDSSLEDEKSKEDRPSSSHLSTLSGTSLMKKNLAMTSPHYHSKWKTRQDAVC